MKNTTTTETIVVKIGITENENDWVEKTFAFIEDAESHINFDSKYVKVFKRKTIVEEEQIN